MMGNMKVLTTVVALMAVSYVLADDWPGFHGIEKQGRYDSANGPLHWSPSSNVAWKTVIPGRGHSSPILSGDSVYLTTAYERSLPSSAQKTCGYTVFGLSVLFTIAGILAAGQSLAAGTGKMDRLRPQLRLFLFAMVLSGTMIVILFGRRLLNLEDDSVRPWIVSIMAMLCCLALGIMFTPFRSRRRLTIASLSILFTIPAFLVLKDKELIFAFGSIQGLIATATLVLPAVFGIGLLAAYMLGRRIPAPAIRGRHDAAAIPRSGRCLATLATAGAGVLMSLMLFFLLLYRAANYQMPDHIILENRIRPDVSWGWIGLYAALVVAAIARLAWRPVRGRLAGKPSCSVAFPITAVALGIAFFINSNFIAKQEEFIRAVVCLDRSTGRIAWTCEGLVGRKGEGEGRTVTYASATPVTDGERVYAYFGEDGLMCVSREGRLLWKKEEPMFRGNFGVGTSPIVSDGILVIVSDVIESPQSPSSIMAFDCMTGNLLWSRERKSHQKYDAYGTPLVRSLGARETIIVHGWHDVRGYDLKTGQELWAYPMVHKGMHLVASPVCDAERLYVMGASEIRALDIRKLGTADDPLVWSQPVPGEKSATPVVVDGLLFLATEPGVAYCLEAGTGKVLWKERLKGRYFSSVVAAGNKVLFTSESGQTTVVAANREFQRLAGNTVDGFAYASCAPAGSQLFIRTTRYLYCIEENER